MSTNLNDLKHLLNLLEARKKQFACMEALPNAYGPKVPDECKGQIKVLERAIERLKQEPDVAEIKRLKEMDIGLELGDALTEVQS